MHPSIHPSTNRIEAGWFAQQHNMSESRRESRSALGNYRIEEKNRKKKKAKVVNWAAFDFHDFYRTFGHDASEVFNSHLRWPATRTTTGVQIQSMMGAAQCARPWHEMMMMMMMVCRRLDQSPSARFDKHIYIHHTKQEYLDYQNSVNRSLNPSHPINQDEVLHFARPVGLHYPHHPSTICPGSRGGGTYRGPRRWSSIRQWTSYRASSSTIP
ncbi:hypothetical protein BC832DRAFT_340706 [Gaertneriomyces semiglobifer]|nr:hypothetical protein BC832DRAFT_340706 [Gaertneriomyces semiglobifer]